MSRAMICTLDFCILSLLFILCDARKDSELLTFILKQSLTPSNVCVINGTRSIDKAFWLLMIIIIIIIIINRFHIHAFTQVVTEALCVADDAENILQDQI